MAPQTILLAAPSYHERQVLGAFLRHGGFHVVEATRGADARALAETLSLSLIVLDRELPPDDGLAVATQLREQTSVPVIMIGQQATAADRVEGLRRGLDDYLAKPVDGLELVARVEAILRRAGTEQAGGILHVAQLTIDLYRHIVLPEPDRQPLALRPKEFQLLSCLARTPGRVWTRDELLAQIWGADYIGYDRVVDVTIARLRQALGASGSLIETVPGFGYRLAQGEVVQPTRS